MRADDGKVASHLADLFEAKERVAKMVEHAEEEDDIVSAETIPAYIIDAQFMKLAGGTERLPGLEEVVRAPAVDRNDRGSAAFRFETVESIPAANVEQPRPGKIVWQLKTLIVITKLGEWMDTGSNGAVRQLNTVPPLTTEHLFPAPRRVTIDLFAQLLIVLISTYLEFHPVVHRSTPLSIWQFSHRWRLPTIAASKPSGLIIVWGGEIDHADD